MTTYGVLEIVTLVFNPSLQPSPSEPPAAFVDVTAQLKAAPGVIGVWSGYQIEQPQLFRAFVYWTNREAHASFVASEAFGPWKAGLVAVLIDESSPEAKSLPPRQPAQMVNISGGSIDASLSAPTTEVFSCYGVDDGFLENNIKPFADGVEGGAIPGYHGLVYGGFSYQGPDQPKGDATKLLLGWDSKEAHEAQRGEGKGKLPRVRAK